MYYLTFHRPFGMPYFLSKNSRGARPGAAAVGWAGEPRAPTTATRESRDTFGTRSWQACCGWFPSPWGCKGSSSSHGWDSGTLPLPPPLGLEGFAFHMAPGWGRWAQGSGCSCSCSGGPGEPGLPRNPTSRRAAGSSTPMGPRLERRRLGGEGHLLTHHISPLPASFSVSATGWRAGEGSEARYSRVAGGGR